MKTLALIALSTLLTISSVNATPNPQEASIDLLSSKHKNLFIFKVDRKFKGANVEVSYANGEVITNLKMEKRKLIIDFCDVKFGSYVIKVKKGNNVEEFQYIKK